MLKRSVLIPEWFSWKNQNGIDAANGNDFHIKKHLEESPVIMLNECFTNSTDSTIRAKSIICRLSALVLSMDSFVAKFTVYVKQQHQYRETSVGDKTYEAVAAT